MPSPLSIVSTITFLFLVQAQYVIDKTKVLKNKALGGYAFRNLTMKTVDDCFLDCFEDCFCMAFQMCGGNSAECQLLSSNQFLTPSALVTSIRCSYYDMLPDSEQVSSLMVNNCSPPLTCEFQRNLCEPNGKYVAVSLKDNLTPRFKCECKPGYAGTFCQNLVKSCRGYNNDDRVSGKKFVFRLDKMRRFKVFCDFDSRSTMAWTLVQSYQLQVKTDFAKAFSVSWSVNQSNLAWNAYRLSKRKMQSLQNDSTKWRITCNYDTDGVVPRDFVQASFKQVDIMKMEHTHVIKPKKCSTVEYIDVRGYNCTNCTVKFYQSKKKYPFHLNGGPGCKFQVNEEVSCSHSNEDSFGYYECVNPDHRCASSGTATTQVWFGGD